MNGAFLTLLLAIINLRVRRFFLDISFYVFVSAHCTHDREPHMRGYLKKLSSRKPVVYTGDLNCGHLDLDIHNPEAKHIAKQSGLTPQERQAFTQMLEETKYRDAFRYFHPGM
jgi:exonuclease III